MPPPVFAPSHNAGLKVNELERIAAAVTDDRQRNERALLDSVAEVSGTAGLDRLSRTEDLDRLG